jgi:2-methylisocitrate lyase-like PEP mutase family enzyme
MMAVTVASRLRARLSAAGDPLLLPGAPNALTARVLQEAGFEAIYVSGAGVANTFLGVPDVGLLTLNEITAHVAAIREVVDLPLVVDADTGFGNAINVQRTVRLLEKAGAQAIQIEDQVMPKRCGHFDGKVVIETSEMVGKIHAAVDARDDQDLLIIARTDARAELGLEEACDRAARYVTAGADVAFVEAPRGRAEMEAIIAKVPGPHLVNMVEGGFTPIMPLAQLAGIGYSIVLYANTAMRAAISSMRASAAELREKGDSLSLKTPIASWEERQSIVDKSEFDRLNDLYGSF